MIVNVLSQAIFNPEVLRPEPKYQKLLRHIDNLLAERVINI